VSTGVHEGCAELEVASSGPVVPVERVAELFEPFRRGEVARTGVPGSGLGLSIVRAVAKAHGGVARAEPVAGGGLAVTVHLPAALAPDATDLPRDLPRDPPGDLAHDRTAGDQLRA
jgi:signal transduction histidine kinase